MKKIPMRQCVGCREMKEKRSMLRVVRSPEGRVSLDPTGKKPGRGAYVCRSEDCLKRAIKSRALERAFMAPVGAELLDEMRSLLDGAPSDGAAPDGGSASNG